MELKELCLARGTSGREEQVRDLVRSALPSDLDSVTVDRMGNLLVAKGQDHAGPSVLLLAHMDEVGLMVTGHTPDGRLRIRAWGGVPPSVVAGKSVLVGAAGLPGAIGRPPNHFHRGEGQAAPKYDDLYVDIGAADAKTAQSLAPVGEMITFATPYRVSPDGGSATCKAFDDRAGVWLALEMLRHAWDFPLHVAFTVQEEVGLRGAQVALRAVRPDLVLALEATAAADTPDAPPGRGTRIGDGPALTTLDRSSRADEGLREALARAGEAAGVPWQWRRGIGGGNEAGAAWLQGYRSAAVSVPCRYLHAPVSLISLRDLEAARSLLQRFLENVREVRGHD
jgi:endoglucanase